MLAMLHISVKTKIKWQKCW